MKQSLWLPTDSGFSSPSIQQPIKCDICIIGGGISGVYTAYSLAKEGFQVVLIEALPQFANGTTAYSTGKLTVQHNLIYSKLTPEDGKIYYEANKFAIEKGISENNSGFTRATSYLYTSTSKGKEQLLNEAELYKKIGIPFEATNETELNLPVELAIGIKNEGQINPVQFTNAFVHLARKYGAQLYLNTRVTNIELRNNQIRTSNGYTVQYNKLILCTHYPIESIRQLYSIKLQIKRSYLTATKSSQLLDGQYLSIDDQSRTIRSALIDNQPYFIYGGQSHLAGSTGDTDRFYEALQHELTTDFELPPYEYAWSAQDIMTADQVPYIGQLSPDDDSLYVATGFNKWGLSSSLVAGNLLTDLIKNVPNDAANLFSPHRSSFGKNLYFMLQTGGVIGKELVGGYLKRPKAPRCTHLGCKTRWNEADQTYDCPCHGSRYNAEGQVIEGPAVYPLDIKKSGHSN
ncbi:FAD-dependent oxidoreductase [Solibacillus sp. A46]|uniref:FAD-dependent oxidoreductase n=1 Tax=Solibacillus faecavium TaxID=2762221 RepID=A0ABR8Y282_9BACL|nr:FAD-dependent oxidoreductase [Solibacillus faecavium]MBD8038317.1 FAD-dependent oxidoreductase [Solibacillus faecavium]